MKTYIVNQNIKRIVTDRRLRPCEVERRAGMKAGVVSRIMSGKRKVYADEVIPIAMALGVSLDELFKGTCACKRVQAD